MTEKNGEQDMYHKSFLIDVFREVVLNSNIYFG